MEDVFPARAGVILGHILAVFDAQGFPRTRGGDPVAHVVPLLFHVFSPHARG